jgi:hypothetical protein
MTRDQQKPDLEAVGIGFTLATGELWCSMTALQAYAEELLGGPVMTHDFAIRDTWDELRDAFRDRVREANA